MTWPGFGMNISGLKWYIELRIMRCPLLQCHAQISESLPLDTAALDSHDRTSTLPEVLTGTGLEARQLCRKQGRSSDRLEVRSTRLPNSYRRNLQT